ncbi:MAG: phosphodiesterase [Lachnospiraceae bacterium]|jgi:putative phosphoesterase|nr:phosphodiesterase [Lachnospiraceae bacterium]MCH4030683.1 phosphodiesterase [Lachnospiraceae bacterium]MCH4069892.1 phosphodiesterase [Lachnospiraceae bacterium]MCH4107169.1 phosphodiesterase [Lachnospiraceae bacterium]MCI1301976.1 phosphodiesterase [Lachnospiraceae bacterium]
MKLMIASDIHGSAFYCCKMLAAMEQEKPDKLILLGDILYHGPRNDLPEEYAPKKVIAMLNPLRDKILCIRGNCDTEVDQMVLDFSVLSEQAILFVNGKTLVLKHGHRLSGIDLPPVEPGEYLVCGHTHVPKMEMREGGYWYINPGSVSLPKGNSPHSYCIFEDHFVWKDLDGEVFMEETAVS